MTTGLIAAPCTGPVLTGILLWIGKTRNVALGAAATGAFSLGLGLPFWIAGTFAVSLPKGGSWMVTVKAVFGVALAVCALHVLKSGFPVLGRVSAGSPHAALIATALVATGLALGALRVSWGGGTLAKVRKSVAVIATIAGAFVGVTALEGPERSLAWEPSVRAAHERATSEHRPMILDFSAEWCSACRELARITFADQRVAAEASRFVATRVDATNAEDPSLETLEQRYGVVGLPTIILLDSQGRERSRLTEFVPPEQFVDLIRQID